MWMLSASNLKLTLLYQEFRSRKGNVNSDEIYQYIKHPTGIKPHIRSALMTRNRRGLWSAFIVRRHTIKPIHSIGSCNRHHNGECQSALNEKIMIRSVNWVLDTQSDWETAAKRIKTKWSTPHTHDIKGKCELYIGSRCKIFERTGPMPRPFIWK